MSVDNCEKWNKLAFRNMLNVIIIFLIITIPCIVFLYLSDDSNVVVNYDLSDSTFEPETPILVNSNKSLYLGSDNATFEPSYITLYLIPKYLENMFIDETELTQTITNIYASDDAYHNTLVSKMLTYDTIGYVKDVRKIEDMIGSFNLVVSADYYVMVSVDITIKNTTYIEMNFINTIQFFFISGGGAYSISTGRYYRSPLIEVKKLQQLTIQINSLSYTNEIEDYQNFVMDNTVSSYYDVPSYPFLLTGVYNYVFNL